MALKGWSLAALVNSLKSAAFLDVGTGSDTVAAGDDSRITGAAQKAQNLNDLANKNSAWANLGGRGAGKLDVGTTANTVAAGDDGRITGAAQKSQNLNDLENKDTAWTNLGGGNAGKATLVESMVDITAGRVLTVGYMGLGSVNGRVDTNGANAQGPDLPNGFSYSSNDSTTGLGTFNSLVTLNLARGARPCRLHMSYDSRQTLLSYYSGNQWYYSEVPQIWNGTMSIDGKIVTTDLSSVNNIKVGNARFGTTGDCFGSTWGGGWLSAYLTTQFNGKGNINTASKNTNGWWRCGSTGIIVQWGVQNVDGATVNTYSFPTAFPTGNASLVVSNNIERTAGENSMTGYMKSRTQFSLSNTAATGRAICWIAIGW